MISIALIIGLVIGFCFGYLICYVKLRDEKLPPNGDSFIQIRANKKWN
jgi:hypothetical protein